MCVHAGQVATGACLWHTCPGDLSPGGEVAIVYWAADGSQEIMTVSGQGTMPAAATLEKYAELGLSHPEETMPGSDSRRRDCHFDDTPCLSLLKHLLKAQGGAIK